MELRQLRLIVPAVLTAGALLPRAGYHAARLYQSGYEASAEYIDAATTATLQRVGLQPIPTEQSLEAEISRAAIRYKLPPPLLGALVHTESSKDSDAYSPKGAIGLAQIMPANAKRCGLPKASRLWDDRTNLDCGAKILAQELATYRGDLEKALQAYNGGAKCVGKCSESLAYSKRILKLVAQSTLAQYASLAAKED